MRSTRARTIAIFTLVLIGCEADAPSTSTTPVDSGQEAFACPAGVRDEDHDEVCDDLDNCPGVPNPQQTDGDKDGVGDACAVTAQQPCAGHGGDSDEDDVCQAIDNCPATVNPEQLDADHDGIGDACDEAFTPCVFEGGDTDDDGICNPLDNCVTKANPDQSDSDGDHLGDACDPVNGESVCAGKGGDHDDDDVCDAFDNCASVANSDQSDQDKDGMGDVCDSTPNPCDAMGGDTDGDTICEFADNCPDKVNANQSDADHDGIGDACDEPIVPTEPGDPCSGLGGDADHDNWCAIKDNCPAVHNPSQSDIDADGKGDVCDTEECDGKDNDGDGEVDEGFPNADGDDQADCVDPCPYETNADTDQDGKVDCVDPCPADAANDVDGDGLCAGDDNCPLVANLGQDDIDGDGVGNACDAEECDGKDNDGDWSTDEGMPDQDKDGTCDAIDKYPTDPDDDLDHDGLCAGADNCANVSNAGQADTDGDGWGDACDLDSSSVSCGASAPLSQPGAVPLPSDLKLTDLVTDPVRQVVYASVPPGVSSWANNVIAIDPATKSILWSLLVGTDPRQLAVSQDGSRLYVALWGSASVRVIDPAQRRGCMDFSLGAVNSYGALQAVDMDVLPGKPEVLVVSTRRTGVSPGFGGVYVFDHGSSRPLRTAGHSGASSLAVASDTMAYGHNNNDTGFQFYALTISDQGIEKQVEYDGLFSYFYTELVYSSGRVYATSGEVIDPGPPVKLAGNFNAKGKLAVDPALGRLYVLRANNLISVYRTSTLAWLKDISLTGNSGTDGTRIVRWGEDGLAALIGGKAVIVMGAAN